LLCLPHLTSAFLPAYNEEEVPESERRTSRFGHARHDYHPLMWGEWKLVVEADVR
jgi:hypothetical protein